MATGAFVTRSGDGAVREPVRETGSDETPSPTMTAALGSTLRTSA